MRLTEIRRSKLALRDTRGRKVTLPVMSLVGLLAMPSVASASWAPPDEAEITRISTAYQSFAESNAAAADFEQKATAYCTSLLEDHDLGEWSTAQVQGLLAVLLQCPARHEELHERLTELASNATTDGALAAGLDFQLAVERGDDAETNRALRKALAHDAMPAAIGEGSEGAELFLDAFNAVDSEVLFGTSAELLAFGRALPDQIPGSILPSTLFYYLALLRTPDGEVDVAASEPIRQHLAALFTKEADTAAQAKRDDARYLQSRVAMLDGAYARRTLMNKTAPPMEILWSSKSALVPSLDALRGKIVVLDYWAIWCAPCIAKFPEMRDLQARYAGLDVEIIGMTSVQGYHLDPDKGYINCSNDPEKEFNLISGYMGQKDMTWTVAHSRQSCFNNDYGVVSLPHMAILDAEGRVRFNNIPASTPPEEIGAMIDMLLREAELRVPEK